MIEAVPRNKEIVKESGYTKTIALVRQDNYVVVRSIGFLENNKTKYLDIKRLHEEKGVWLVDEMTMTTKKGNSTLHTTILQFSNIELNEPLSDDMFTTRRLEKGL
jgi:hypothetical protein